MIDTHSHIYLDDFKADRTAMLKRAKAVGIESIYLPNIDSKSISTLKALAQGHPHCIPMMGLHPGSVKENWEEELHIILNEIDTNPSLYKAIGEIGIDLYWDKTFLEAQQICFSKQIEKAKALKLPIVIHCREAFDEIFEVLEQHKGTDLFGVFHCFTGNHKQAEKAISYNLKLGIGGIVTFKNAGLDKVVEQIDSSHLVLETDAPYLAPHPHRGKRNEPAFMQYTAQKIADIKEMPLASLIEITTANAQQIFKP